jgi:hypothetical protein
MGGPWDGMTSDNRVPAGPSTGDISLRTELKELQERVGRLALFNQALWELLQAKTGITEDELMAKALEIDLRDGMQDDAITVVPLRCPNCSRVSSSKHWKCLYCGQEFQRPVMG